MECAYSVAVVGLGRVGATTVFSLLHNPVVTEIYCVVRDLEKALGELYDFEHAVPLLHPTKLHVVEHVSEVPHADLWVITAGQAQEPGETRLQLSQRNIKIVTEILQDMHQHHVTSPIMMVSNPVDVLVEVAHQLGVFAPGQVFGTGTYLDTTRFRAYLAERLQVHPQSIHAYVLGEHGEHAFPALSSAQIGGLPLASYPGYQKEMSVTAFQQTRQAAQEIIKRKGATYYAIATVVRELVEMLYADAQMVVPLSVSLAGYYGHENIAMSVPCVVGRAGIIKTLPLPLNALEQSQLQRAVSALRPFVSSDQVV